MKSTQLFVIAVTAATVVSCKKDTLHEVVDVPATPIVAVKQKGGKPTDVKAAEGAFQILELPYGYTALEPHFDALTTEIHYSKHLLGYVNSLNKSIVGTKYETLELDAILKNLNASDAVVRNNAGGVYNHNFFLEGLGPATGKEPEGALMESINKDFGSFEEFRNQFTEASLRFIGSGWTWLVSDKTGKLKIVNTANNDNPLMKNLGITSVPILNLDLWEHAYYLKFQNRKREYVNTFFSVVNWEKIEKRYDAFPKAARSSVPTETAVEAPGTETPVQAQPVVTPKPEEKTGE
ncbi:superoxide dismutase [Flavobacterium humi]|uniref:superoxide dismutase n=1 Tax=Flavobacterium humi TaxID=2562683 RepID=A0A4Z0L934_9FLAO|nr:superoxide dismutase [Flavobacterium humi]TGD58284.1 superoxide dismutase [Flavobacterium humi]